MTKQNLTIATGILLGLGIITFFVPGLKVWAYGLFMLGFGCLLYTGYKFVDKKRRPAVITGGLILFLLTLHKFFNTLGH